MVVVTTAASSSVQGTSLTSRHEGQWRAKTLECASEGDCVIACAHANACSEASVQCPSKTGSKCTVICSTPHSCYALTVNVITTAQVDAVIECQDSQSCEAIHIDVKSIDTDSDTDSDTDWEIGSQSQTQSRAPPHLHPQSRPNGRSKQRESIEDKEKDKTETETRAVISLRLLCNGEQACAMSTVAVVSHSESDVHTHMECRGTSSCIGMDIFLLILK